MSRRRRVTKDGRTQDTRTDISGLIGPVETLPQTPGVYMNASQTASVIKNLKSQPLKLSEKTLQSEAGLEASERDEVTALSGSVG